MAYTKQQWGNGDPATPVNAERLDHIEQGIADAHAALEELLSQPLARQEDVFATRVRLNGGTGDWEPANRQSFKGLIWIGMDPSSSEQLPGDLRQTPEGV